MAQNIRPRPNRNTDWYDYGGDLDLAVRELQAQVAALQAAAENPTPTQPTDTSGPGGPVVNFSNLWKSPQPVDNLVAAYPQLSAIAEKPHALWVGDWNPNPQSTVSGYATAAAGKTMILPLYAIPNRDNGGYSAGGFPDRASYLNWVRGCVTGAGSAPVVWIYEPDALGHAPELTATIRAERIETMRQAINILAATTNGQTFIDMGMWVDATTAADLLASVDVSKVAGVALNVSAFNTQADCYTKGNAIIAALNAKGITGKKYVVDSGRNGNGPLTAEFGAAATPWLEVGQGWCNPPGRGLGLAPGTPTGQANCAATLWIKGPGGSDGDSPRLTATPDKFVSNYFGEDAPGAGTFWVKWALDCIAYTAVASSPLSTLTDTFTGGLGKWPRTFGAVTTVNGRARITCDTGFTGLSSARAYSFTNSSAAATIYAPDAAGATVEAYVDMLIESPTDGTRINTRINTIANTITFSVESGYYDPNSLSIAYNATTMRRIRLRETGGQSFFDTSPDGATWTTRRTAPTPAWAANGVSLTFSSHRNNGTANYAEVSNVNA